MKDKGLLPVFKKFRIIGTVRISVASLACSMQSTINKINDFSHW
jgi:hypothetical protein